MRSRNPTSAFPPPFLFLLVPACLSAVPPSAARFRSHLPEIIVIGVSARRLHGLRACTPQFVPRATSHACPRDLRWRFLRATLINRRSSILRISIALGEGTPNRDSTLPVLISVSRPRYRLILPRRAFCFRWDASRSRHVGSVRSDDSNTNRAIS